MTEPGLDRASIRRSLDELGVRPSKRLGQNFLSSPSVARRIADEATRGAPACIVEIGPGLGSITRFLAETRIPVVAVEIDRRLADYLAQEFTGHSSVEIRADDALEVDLQAIAAVHGERLTIAGSIPYSITAPILKRIVSQRTEVRSAILVTQREVAEKIAASPGKDGSALGVYVQAYADVEVLRRIPRGAFFPIPDVDSTLWSLQFGRPRRFEASEAAFFFVVRALYGARRKTTRNALRRVLSAEDVESVLAKAGIDGAVRGETLGFLELDAIARSVDAAKCLRDGAAVEEPEEMSDL
ncbi:MAG: 16S rRNA (adenine(1518)-N(6)/adenine(1519)-N(6))-dimethyltransferase RsmA [Thermotogota bacterium]